MKTLNCTFNTEDNPFYYTNLFNFNTQYSVKPQYYQYLPKSSLLGKRGNQVLENCLYEKLQKKVKPSQTIPQYTNPHFHCFTLNFNKDKCDIKSLSHLKAVNIKVEETEKSLNSSSQSYLCPFQVKKDTFASLDNSKQIKEEFKHTQKDFDVKQEDISTWEMQNACDFKTFLDKDRQSETTCTYEAFSETSERHLCLEKLPIIEESALSEFTRGFPEWDLATIFTFLNSGRSKESFEKERTFRNERKRRRRERRKLEKEKK